MPQEDSRNPVSRFRLSGGITSWNPLVYLFVRSGKKEDTSLKDLSITIKRYDRGNGKTDLRQRLSKATAPATGVQVGE